MSRNSLKVKGGGNPLGCDRFRLNYKLGEVKMWLIGILQRLGKNLMTPL